MKTSSRWKWFITIVGSAVVAYLGIAAISIALTVQSAFQFSRHPEIPEAIALRQRASIFLGIATPIRWGASMGSSLPVVGARLSEVAHLYTAVQHLLADLAPLDTTTAKTWADLVRQPDEWNLIVSAVIRDQELLTTVISLASTSGVSGSSSLLPSWLLSALSPFQQTNPEDLERVATAFLGLDEKQTYLLLFQNENELRPTGGFLGSYAEITIEDATLVSLFASDTYALDRASPVSFDAPWYLVETIAPRLYLRDANLNPHVPQTAQTILSLYAAEGGKASFDGVLFITPKILTDILSVTGPIAIAETPYVFEAETAIETLQRAVEIDYTQQGIPEEDRKRVLRLLLDEISLRFFSADRSLQRKIIPLTTTWLVQRDMQMYHVRPDVERSLVSLGWAGEWIPSSLDQRADIIGFTDTNLGGLKSDRVLDRALTGSISIDSTQRAIHDLTLTTTHKGSDDPLIGAYQSYRQWSLSPAATDISLFRDEEVTPVIELFRKLTMVSSFMKVREYQTNVERLRSTTPISLSADGNSYHLYLPKQAGMRRVSIDLNITTPFEIRAIMGSGIQVVQTGPNSVRVSGDLLQSGDLVLSSTQ